MNLVFEEISIEGFQSIGNKCTLDLSSQGLVMIKGINEYDDKALSNGSGKSSIVEAINWCIFGKTSSGVSDVKNKYYHNNCSVSLKIKKDSENYEIVRFITDKNNGVQLFKDKEDISCRNKTDTNKLILSSVIPFSQDIFLSTIFLSQGFSGRLSLLSPSARKERLEILSNIDTIVNEFKNKISTKKSIYYDKCSEIRNKIYYSKGQSDIYIREKTEIEELKSSGEINIPDVPIESLRNKIASFEKSISEISEEKNVISSELGTKNSELVFQSTTLENKKRELLKLKTSLEELKKEPKCPTCNQVINKDIHQDLINSSEESINKLVDEITQCKKQYSELSDEKNLLQAKKDALDSKYSTLMNLRNKVNDTIREYESAIDKNSALKFKISRLDECLSKIAEFSKQIKEFESDLSKEEIKLEVSEHVLRLITKEFRSFLLTDIINQMNEKLREYSKQLFENESDSIRLSTDDTKLNIFSGDTPYESLSGGEKKKVDLALVLAQRDIALRISGFQCNLLVLDEILENMDETSSNVSLNLLNQVSEEIDSLFIISHNNYSIPVDSTITVVKKKNRISEINC